MKIWKKIKLVSNILGICLILFIAFNVYLLFLDSCWNCSPQDYFDRGIAMISKDDNKKNKKGFRYLQSAAEKGNVEAQIFLGELYLDTFPDDYSTAYKDKIAALRNTVPVDKEKGVSYFKELAANVSFTKSNYSKMQYNMGLLYKAGLLKSEDKDEVEKKWFAISANHGDPLANYQMGIYLNNQGKYVEARELFTKLFDSDEEPGSAIMIGDHYCYGKGVAKDYHQAIEWYQRAIMTLALPNISLSNKKRKRLTELAIQRLDIAERKVNKKSLKDLVTLKYSLSGGVNAFSIFLSDKNGLLIGEVKKQNGDIIALIKVKPISISDPMTLKVSSMSEGLFWVLNSYAKNKYGANKHFKFVINR
jgi:tetratricopeptide (TPR) repeat protein